MRGSVLAVILAMAVVTYLGRVLPLLQPSADRLPGKLRDAIPVVGPATLGALAASAALLATDRGTTTLTVGPLLPASIVALLVARLSGNISLSIVAAVILTATIRWLGAL
jgi:branched-subunit amino acid transport protein